MCGRIKITVPNSQLSSLSKLSNTPKEYSNKVAQPNDDYPIIIKKDHDRYGVIAEWGYLPSWADPNDAQLLFNAREETLLEKPTFREAQPCIVPVSEFFEKKHTISFDSIISLAGIWCLNGDIPTFAIVTKEARGGIEKFHNRMPVILKDNDLWLENMRIKEDTSAFRITL